MNALPRFALLANPGSRRALGFASACRTQGLPEPRVIAWESWLTAGFDSPAALEGIDSLRIETPAENTAVERLLLARGADACEAEGKYPCLAREACPALAEDAGELRYQRQWYYGWRSALSNLAATCESLHLQPMNRPDEIAVLFDKHATRTVLERHAVPVPPSAGICQNFDDLVSRMDASRWDRIFLKPCHGSSASGVMAIVRNSRGAWQATTSAVLEAGPDGVRIRNSKNLQRIGHLQTLRSVVNAVCTQRAIIERWFPKATLRGRAFDLRVLVIRGQATHVAVRTSRHSITNLHLRNSRGEIAAVIESIGTLNWQAALETAVAAAAAFPGCHYAGVDLMIGPGGRTRAIAEVNAFGDLLHRERWHGMDPWEAEIALWQPIHHWQAGS